jgi:hypothetical protein
MRRAYTAGWAVRACAALLGLALPAAGQTLRFDAYREPTIPENANIRLGDWFYSDVLFSLSAGYRYVHTSGPGGDVLYRDRHGRIRKDGSELPIVGILDFHNYLLLSRHADLDVSFQLRYSYFPLETEDNEFAFEMADVGVFARVGSFSFQMTEDSWIGRYAGDRVSAYVAERGAGFMANIGSDFQLTPFLRGRLYDAPSYRADYVDPRGLTDILSGDKYRVFQNIAGADLDWLVAKDKNLTFSASRSDTLPLEDEFENVRSVAYREMVGYQQQVTPAVLAGVRADLTQRLFTGDTIKRGDQFQQEYSGYTGIQATDYSVVRGSLGYSRTALRDPGPFEEEGDTDTIVGSAELQTQLAERLLHAFTYGRTQRSGFRAGVEKTDALGYHIDWTGDWLGARLATIYRSTRTDLARISDYREWMSQLALSVPVARALALSAGTVYTRRWNGPLAEGGPDEDDPRVAHDFDTWVSTLGVTFSITPHLALTGYGEHTVRWSDDPDLELTREAAGITLTYTYDF